MSIPTLIAFTGYSGTGKSTLAREFNRVWESKHDDCWLIMSPGDIIKADLSIHPHLEPWTEDREKKRILRPLFESYGDASYESVMGRYFKQIDGAMSANLRVINHRLCRKWEAEQWTKRGGMIVHVEAAYDAPHTKWESEALESVKLSFTIFRYRNVQAVESCGADFYNWLKERFQ